MVIVVVVVVVVVVEGVMPIDTAFILYATCRITTDKSTVAEGTHPASAAASSTCEHD
jgi:hypothetical protein